MVKKQFFTKNNKIKIFVVLYFFFILACFIFYPNQKLIVKGITESSEGYSVKKTYNSTEIYFEEKTYFENECKSFPENRGDVYILDINTYDFFYQTNNYLGDCTISNTPSSDERHIKITNSNDIDLTYPISLEYFVVKNCNIGSIQKPYDDQIPTAKYGNFTVRAGESYDGYLTYKKVYEVKPVEESKSLTAFSFWVDDPQSCEQVKKTKQIEKTRPIKVTKNETLYNAVFKDENLTIRVSFFQKWTLGDNITSYGCPLPYSVAANNSCYRKIE